MEMEWIRRPWEQCDLLTVVILMLEKTLHKQKILSSDSSKKTSLESECAKWFQHIF